MTLWVLGYSNTESSMLLPHTDGLIVSVVDKLLTLPQWTSRSDTRSKGNKHAIRKLDRRSGMFYY